MTLVSFVEERVICAVIRRYVRRLQSGARCRQWRNIGSDVISDGHLCLVLTADGGIYELERGTQ
jgi:hypothetical protein